MSEVYGGQRLCECCGTPIFADQWRCDSCRVPTPPASHDAGKAVRRYAATGDYAYPVSESADGEFVLHDDYTTLTAEVSRLTGELAEASARLHEVATLCATVEQERDRLTAELEKEKAQSRHLAGAVSRKIDELIAAENQCGYYKMQYSRAEQVRKEACEANAKAQAAMLWLEADLERSRKECERLRAWAESLENDWVIRERCALINGGMRVEQACIHAETRLKMAKVAALSASGREGVEGGR